MTRIINRQGPQRPIAALPVPAPENTPSISAADIKNEISRLLRTPQAITPPDASNLFLVSTAGHWMQQASNFPSPQMLFSEFWHEGELCILFADTNLGKSILAVQIGDSISRGEAIKGFKLQSKKQPVLYFDFELSVKQFEARYSVDYTQHYKFEENFYRAEINPDAELPDERHFEDFLNRSIEESIVRTGARVLIIDNLTYLKIETEKAQNALPLMKHLKALKQRYGLSILALAHTPKRDLSSPVTRNDLQGSKMLMNFCDSAFAIGESHSDKNVRYLKQIKQRFTECVYDSNNVIVCQTIKPHNFLQFEFVEFATEWDHLRKAIDPAKDEVIKQVKALSAQGMSQREIAKELDVSVSTVNKYLKR